MSETILVLFFALTNRLLPAIKNIVPYDVYGHIYYAKLLKVHGGTPWSGICTQAWNPRVYYHPFLWHWIVGLFSIDSVLKHQPWINAIVDAFFSVAVYLLLTYLGFSNQEALLGFLLYLLTPMFFSRLSIGPRVDSFTPRLSSEILVNLYFVFLIFDFGLPLPVQLLVCSVIGAVVILSSKFGLQALVILTTIGALIAGQLFGLLPLLASIALVMLVSRGRAISFLIEQWKHLCEYFKRNLMCAMNVSKRNSLLYLLKDFKSGKITAKRLVSHLIVINSYTAVIFKFPLFLVLMIMLAYSISTGQDLELASTGLWIVLAATAAYFLVNFRYFLFLGEAERYLNHVSIIIIVCAIEIAEKLGVTSILWALVIYGALFYAAELFLVFKTAIFSKNNFDADEVLHFLKKTETKHTILLFPYHAVGVYRIMLTTLHEVIFPYFMKNTEREQFIYNFEVSYPFLNLNCINEIVERTGADVIVADKTKLSETGYAEWTPPVCWKKVHLNQKSFDIYVRER